MANEFKIKHGFHSSGNGHIEGDLSVSTSARVADKVVLLDGDLNTLEASASLAYKSSSLDGSTLTFNQGDGSTHSVDLSSLGGTATSASYALSASHAERADLALTANNATSASQAERADLALTATSSSHALQADSASYALTASYVIGGGGGSTPTLDQVVSVGNVTTGSITVGDTTINGRLNLSSGSYGSVIIGTDAGVTAPTFGIVPAGHVAIGFEALKSTAANTRGQLAIGYKSMTSTTTGQNNTAVGQFTLENNTTGYQNVALGYVALRNNIIGLENTAIGQAALLANKGSYNTAVGASAGYNNNTGEKNTYIGAGTAESNQTGNESTVVGYDAGTYYGTGTISTMSGSVFLGSRTFGKTSTSTNEIVIGYLAQGKGDNTVVVGNTDITDTYLRGNVRTSGSAYILGLPNTSTPNVVGFDEASGQLTYFTASLLGGSGGSGGSSESASYASTASYALTASYVIGGSGGSVPTLDQVVGAGNVTAGSITVGETTINGKIAIQTGSNGSIGIGVYALESDINPSIPNTAIGKAALRNTTAIIGSTAVGNGALTANTTGNGNTAVGNNALNTNTTGASNVALGFSALRDNSTASSNTAVGHQAGGNLTTGGNNTAIGHSSQNDGTEGVSNTSVGQLSLGRNVTGDDNAALGNFAGAYFDQGGAGFELTNSNDSVFLGSGTKAKANNSSNEIVIGYNAVGQGNNTVVLGNTSVTNTYLRGNVRTSGSAYLLGLPNTTTPNVVGFDEASGQLTYFTASLLGGSGGSGTSESASYALSSSHAGEALVATLAYQAVSASYATTASYAEGYVRFDSDTYTSSPAIHNIVTLTQAEYDAIGTKDPNTQYLVTDGVVIADTASYAEGYIRFDSDTYTDTPAIHNIVTLTQAEYDAIGTKDPNTQYLVTDGVVIADTASYALTASYVIGGSGGSGDTLYTANGTISTARTVTGTGNNLTFQTFNVITHQASAISLDAGEVLLPGSIPTGNGATSYNLLIRDTSTGQVYQTGSDAFSGGGATSPGGSDGQVQYNNGGSFGGEDTFTYDDANNTLTIKGATNQPSLVLTNAQSALITNGSQLSEVQTFYSTNEVGTIAFVADAGFNQGDTPTRLELRTTNDGAGSPTTKMTIKNNGRVGIGVSSPTNGFLEVNGDVSGVSIYSSADIVAYSDARSKTNVSTIDNALEKVNAVRGVTYNKVEDPEGYRYMGVIAQELQEALPEVVHEGEEGNLSVAYGNITGVLIEAIKELTAKVADLESKLGK